MTDTKINVAVIDDNESITDLLVDLFDGLEQFNVIGQAYDGKEGIELIEEKRPEVVILDLCMPYIDGLGVMEHFQEGKGSYFPKFVITTCIGQEHITAKAMKLGASYYLIKPFDFDFFVSRMNELANEINEPAVQIPKSLLTDEDIFNTHANKASEIMQTLGVPLHTNGYIYLKDAIALVLSDVKYMSKITKNLYPKVAELHNTTASRVERSIRTSIEITLTQVDIETLSNFFGNRISVKNAKLTNSEFISIIAEKIKLRNE